MLREVRTRLSLAYRVLRTGHIAVPRRADIPAILPEEVAEIKSFFPLEKFFIFGHARSGTTLLTRLIRLHPKVHCNYQAHFFTRAPLLEALVADEQVKQWLVRRSNRWNNGRDLSPLVLRAASDLIMERDARRVGKHAPGYLVGDKSPNSLLDGEAVELMHKVYPDAKLVFIIRDGRDAVLSHRFQAFVDVPKSLSRQDLRIRNDFARDPELFLSGQRSLFTERGLRNSATGWAHNIVETDTVARQLLKENYLHLRYEDLLASPWEKMNEVWSFLGADPTTNGLQASLQNELQQNPDADWQQQKAGEITSAIQKGKRGSWKEFFTSRDKQIFSEAADKVLKAWNYTS